MCLPTYIHIIIRSKIYIVLLKYINAYQKYLQQACNF